MNEQRVRDLIEALQKFDGDTRIEGYVNLKWNNKRTAVVVTELEHLGKELKHRDRRVEELENEIRNLESELA